MPLTQTYTPVSSFAFVFLFSIMCVFLKPTYKNGSYFGTDIYLASIVLFLPSLNAPNINSSDTSIYFYETISL